MANGKTVMVVGAAGDICSEVCRRLESDGYKLILIDRDEVRLNRLLNTLDSDRVTPVIADAGATEPADGGIADAVDQHRPEVLINGVGGDTKVLRIEDLTASYVAEKINENLITTFNVTKLCVPHMKAKRYGRIVNFASAGGRTYSHFNNAAYVAAKAAVIGFTKQIAYELAPFDIVANVVAHGPMLTSRIESAWERRPEEQRKDVLNRIPLRRMGTLDEAVGSVMYLASPSAGFTTGSVMDINGGLYM
ncbi:SDR family oxidoreductase [Nguyenibacter vanlangensis]|uniref:SDR family oxidoreductase n=1 Tax=Nguyenibacter vanlangensis TaxID=1216886 RepID=A0ABZ3D8L3_9PROT